MKEWNIETTKLIDEDIKAELKDCSCFYHDYINLQLSRNLRNLTEAIKSKESGLTPSTHAEKSGDY